MNTRRASVSQSQTGWKDVQTVMLRNLPSNCSQQHLVDELERADFGATFDFLYLPVGHEDGTNRGYAFINFVEAATVHRFRARFHGRQLRGFKSRKFVEVVVATLQGFEANFRHFSNTRVYDGPVKTKPLFLQQPLNADALEFVPYSFYQQTFVLDYVPQETDLLPSIAYEMSANTCQEPVKRPYFLTTFPCLLENRSVEMEYEFDCFEPVQL